MAIVRIRTNKSCYELKGTWSLDNNGEYTFQSNGTRYPCGTWRLDPETGQPPISVSPSIVREMKTNVKAPKVYEARNDDDRIADNPVFLVGNATAPEPEIISGTGRVFDPAETINADLIPDSKNTLDAEGNTVADNGGNDGSGNNTESGKMKPVYWLVIAAVVLYAFRKRLGFS